MAYVLNPPKIVSREEWNEARGAFLVKEKELTRARDRLNAERRNLPMTRIEKNYIFEGPNGPVTLHELFDGRDQLIIHHIMFHPKDDRACSHCSLGAGSIGFSHRKLRQGNITLIAVSRAPCKKLESMSKQMGWDFPWYSSYGTSFNEDFGATENDGEVPLLSVLLKMGDDVYQTYWTGRRGLEPYSMGVDYEDVTPLGRQEAWEEPKGRAKELDKSGKDSYFKYPDEWV